MACTFSGLKVKIIVWLVSCEIKSVVVGVRSVVWREES